MLKATQNLTIGRLAQTAQVGVETIRYYQRRKLLPVPTATRGAFRYYPAALADRVRFIKRSQELGFSLEEVRELLRLEQGGNRHAIRKIAEARLQSVRTKMAALARIESVLSKLVVECEHGHEPSPCPIIAALHDDVQRAAPGD